MFGKSNLWTRSDAAAAVTGVRAGPKNFALTATVLAVVPLDGAMALAARHAHNTVPAAVEGAVAATLVLAVAIAAVLWRLRYFRLVVGLLGLLPLFGGAAAALFEVDEMRAAVALLSGALGVLYVSFQSSARGTAGAVAIHVLLAAAVALVHPVLPARAFVVPGFAVAVFSAMTLAGAAYRRANERVALQVYAGERITVPLANVVAHMDYLDSQLRRALPLTDEAELRELWEKLSVEGGSLLGAVQEWLALSCAGSNAHVGVVKVGEAVEQVLCGVSTVLADRGLKLRRVGSTDEKVTAVESLLAHVLLHLVLHAAKARDPGGRELELDVSRLPDGTVAVRAGPPGVEPGARVTPEPWGQQCLCQAMARSLGAHFRVNSVPGGLRYEVHLRGV